MGVYYDHEHRVPQAADFVGKTVERFEPDATNWRLWFTDGTAFAIQHEPNRLALCDTCLAD